MTQHFLSIQQPWASLVAYGEHVETRSWDTSYRGQLIICATAKKMVLDGEGATKFIEIHVKGAESKDQAKKIGLAIANSNLVKTAAFGNNPNWGRVAAAVGSLGIKKIKEDNMDIDFSPFDKKEITITVTLDIGKHSAVVFTSDLSYEYVRINVEYS